MTRREGEGEEEEEQEAATQQPGERRRGETNKGSSRKIFKGRETNEINCAGPERVSHPRRNTTRVIDTELLRKSTRVGIVTGREKEAGHRRVLGSRIRSPGTKIGTSSCILYRSEGPCPLFYTCTNRNIKRENSPVQILKLAVFVTITNLGLLLHPACPRL